MVVCRRWGIGCVLAKGGPIIVAAAMLPRRGRRHAASAVHQPVRPLDQPGRRPYACGRPKFLPRRQPPADAENPLRRQRLSRNRYRARAVRTGWRRNRRGAMQDRGRSHRIGQGLLRHPAAVRADRRARSSRRCRDLGIVSRIGAGFDTVDTDACAAAGVWVANSPDYGVGEVATHALALALASIRNIVAYDRDIHAGQWSFMSSGTMRRPSELTLGIVGLGRIGKRMAHISRNVFKRVVAYDPHIIDGDFPAYVERAASLAALAGAVRRGVAAHAAQRRDARHGRREVLRRGQARRLFRQHVARRGGQPARPGRRRSSRGRWRARRSTSCPRSRCRATRRCSRTRASILTPHAAFYSIEAEKELRRKAAQNIITWLATGRPEYVVTRGTRSP